MFSYPVKKTCVLLPMGAQCAVAATVPSSVVYAACCSPGCPGDLGDTPFQWTLMTGTLTPVLAPDRNVWCLWKAPGHSGCGPCWPSHNVHLHQATEQGTCD